MADIAERLRLTDLEEQVGGILGISAIHLPSLTKVEHNANCSFFLCSTYKLPIAIVLLQKIEQNKLSLTDQISLRSQDLRPSLISTINQLDYSTPVQMSVLNLLAFMLQESCNSSTDALLKLIGGPTVVTQILHKSNIFDLRVDRNAFELICDLEGVKSSSALCTIAEFKDLAAKVTTADLQQLREQLKTDPRDTGTAAAMSELLCKIYNGEILNKEHGALLLRLMSRCKIGSKRIMGLLPTGIKISHKTGTANGYTIDVGIIELPKNLGSIAISVFLQDTGQSLEKDELVIAEITRRIYDYFLFTFSY